jgi:hypothetical protein
MMAATVLVLTLLAAVMVGVLVILSRPVRRPRLKRRHDR